MLRFCHRPIPSCTYSTTIEYPDCQDPNKCIATEKEILSILPIKDLQQCENRRLSICQSFSDLTIFPFELCQVLMGHLNRLVQVLQYENFEFTKLLLKNRLKILCAQAFEWKDKTWMAWMTWMTWITCCQVLYPLGSGTDRRR